MTDDRTPRITDECARLLHFMGRRIDDFGVKFAADTPPIAPPAFLIDQVGSMCACPSDVVEESNPACLMMASAPVVTASCACKPIEIHLDGLSREQVAATPVYFRSEYAILAEVDDAVASARREMAPQCSITLGNLSSCVMNPDLPLLNTSVDGRVRCSLESYVDRITGPGLPWIGGSLHESLAERLEEQMASKLMSVDAMNRELAKMLIRSWVRSLAVWTKTVVLPSVVDVMCMAYHPDWLPERPDLESMVTDLTIQEYRLLVHITRDKVESMLSQLYRNAIDSFAEQFERNYPTLDHSWVNKAQSVCRSHMGEILDRYLDLRYYYVGVFFDAGRSFVRYAACPEPVVCGSFIPVVETSTRNQTDRKEYSKFVLDFPPFRSSKAMHDITLPSETTVSSVSTDRHDRVESAHYAVQRFMFSAPMISAMSVLENPGDPMHMAHPVTGAMVILAVMVIRYLFVAHVMPCLVVSNKQNFLQTIDLGAYGFRNLVLPANVLVDTRSMLLSYRRAIVLEADAICFGKFWTNMLKGSLPQRITACGAQQVDSPDTAVLLPVPPVGVTEANLSPVRPSDMDTDEAPDAAHTSPPAGGFAARGSLMFSKKSPASTKRTAEVLEDPVAEQQQVSEETLPSGDSESPVASASDAESKPTPKRAGRPHKNESSGRKSRLRVRQKKLIEQATEEMAKIAEVISSRHTELNTKGNVDEKTAPKISGQAHAIDAKSKQKLSSAKGTYQHNRISDVNRPWRIAHYLHFFNMHAVYRRIKHTGPSPGIPVKVDDSVIISSVTAPIRGLTMSLHPISVPFSNNLHMGAAHLEHLPKLRIDPNRDTIQPDYKDAETIDVLYQTIKENTTVYPAEYERKLPGKSEAPPLRTLKQVYAIFLYYNNHCHTAGPKIVASQGRHSALLKAVAKRFGLVAPGKTPRSKVFSINTTSLLYPLTVDHRASTTFQPDKWLASMHQPFLHTSDAPLE